MYREFSRRQFAFLAAVGVTSLKAGSIYDSPALVNLFGTKTESVQASVDGAYSFLNTMMDAYAGGNTVRLSQSYSDQGFVGFPQVAFTYDNAVTIMAYLTRGQGEDIQRASVLGNGLIEAQNTNFPFQDGRFAQAYYVNVPDSNGAYITPAAFPFYFYTSAVGDQAWAGMALAQLFKVTANYSYMKAALKVANWIVANTYDTQGPGGYRFGTNINPSNQSVPSTNGKATEHNIDTYAFFTMLETLTHGGKAANGASWSSLAHHALTFVEAMYEPAGGFFYTGTTGDQITISKSPIPEDVQTWSYLALKDSVYGASIDWVTANLLTIDTPSSPFSSLKGQGNIYIQGETFDTASLATSGNDPEAVWLEGTSHTVAALFARQKDSDLKLARKYIKYLMLAQSKLGAGQKVNGSVIPAGLGLIASTGNLDTGFGFDYFPNLHIGATGWYAIAAQAGNPFRLKLA